MLVDFNKTFHPKAKDTAELHDKYKEIHERLLKERRHIKLRRNHKTPPLFHSEPLKGFLGDCRYCEHFREADDRFSDVEWGICNLYHIHCGYGNVCTKVESGYPFDYNIMEGGD